MEEDPGEKNNLASLRPEIIAQLLLAYDAWFDDVRNTRQFTPGPIRLGSDAENPTHLCRYQDSAYIGSKPTGWPVRIENSGQYEFTINRGSETTKAAIFVQFNDRLMSRPLEKGENKATFTLDTGEGKLSVWVQQQGRQRVIRSTNDNIGDVDVRRLSPTNTPASRIPSSPLGRKQNWGQDILKANWSLLSDIGAKKGHHRRLNTQGTNSFFMFVAVSGSLPAHSIKENYPFSHISYWGDKLASLGYDVVGTGEPGWTCQYRMVERFTQDIRGIEIGRVGHQFKSYCTGRILAPQNPDEVKEVLENEYLREILGGCEAKLKATITDPVTVGLQLIANDPSVLRRYPEIFSEVTNAMTPIVERIGRIADIAQFDCPTHLYKPTKNPWQYVNQLAESVGRKPAWLHLDGPSQKFFRNLLAEYDVDVLILNLFGSEESENFEALKENRREIMKHDKKVGFSVINTQVPDEEQNLESEETVLLRLRRLSKILKGDISLIETIMPGCGLNILPNTSPRILERLPRIVRELDW